MDHSLISSNYLHHFIKRTLTPIISMEHIHHHYLLLDLNMLVALNFEDEELFEVAGIIEF